MIQYIHRELETKVKRYMKTKEIIAIVGPRQAGKTTMINHILDEIENKKIERISFDNLKILNLFENDIDSFIELYVTPYDILFIDEIHYSRESGKKLKYIYDTCKTKIVISGSSSLEIRAQSIKYLVGRIFIFHLYPFSYVEFLSTKSNDLLNIYRKKKFGKEILNRLNRYLEEFILYGGYPRVVLSKDKDEKRTVLENIFNTYVLKDVKGVLGIADDYKFITLVKALSLQIGNLINYSELMSLTGLSFHELKKYMNILNKTYICKELPPFFKNRRLELVKSNKVYFFDMGLRNTVINNFSNERSDIGALMENFVLSELIKNDVDVMYWRSKSGAEVDFILLENNQITPIEVKYKLRKNTITKSLLSFIKKYNPKKAYVLSLDFDSKRKVLNTQVNFSPFLKNKLF